MHIVSQSITKPRHYKHHAAALAVSVTLFALASGYALFLDQIIGWDTHLSNWFQSLRTPRLDKAMLLITMLADLGMSVAVISGLCLLLALRQHWWLGFYLVCTFLSTSLVISITKALTQRARPALFESTLTVMSFPSGHAARAFFVFGLAALLFSWGRKTRIRAWVFTTACTMSLMVAISRVYLGVHWVSDVIAGAALAGTMLVAFSWQLHADTSGKPFPAALPTGMFLAVFSAYYLMFEDNQALIYGIAVY